MLPLLPELLGGSADLTGSNLTAGKASVPLRRGQWGNHINYGVREFGMSAHHERHRAARRLHSVRRHLPHLLRLQPQRRAHVGADGQRVLFVFTHDSIGLGEDGPTHQPVEHVASLRLIPNNAVWRPCDAVETMVAWLAAIERRDGPTCLILSRQNLPHFDRDAQQLRDIRNGGYVLAEAQGTPALTLLATGSEVALAMQARAALAAQGIAARVVSMPSCSDFDAQDAEYRAARTAAQRAGAGHRGGREPILARLYRLRWRCDRHRSLRRIGAGGAGRRRARPDG